MATKHHNLQTVVQGVDNWDIPLNANFVEIDKGPTIKATAGETLSSYKVVYRTINNEIVKAIAGTTGDPSSRFIGFTREPFANGATGYAQHTGWISDPNWALSVSAPYYLSTSTAGEITSSKPDGDAILVGYSISTNEILIKPWIEASGQSGGGSGSSSTGTVIIFAGSTAPTGWLLCAGQSVATSTYSGLFSSIGYTYGGSGANFNVPDMRGRCAIGLDNMGGSSANRVTTSDADSLGGSGGTENHTLTTSEIPAHTHTYTNQFSNPVGAGNLGGSPQSQNTGTSSSVGSGSAHNNMQPYMAMSYIIKT